MGGFAVGYVEVFQWIEILDTLEGKDAHVFYFYVGNAYHLLIREIAVLVGIYLLSWDVFAEVVVREGWDMPYPQKYKILSKDSIVDVTDDEQLFGI